MRFVWQLGAYLICHGHDADGDWTFDGDDGDVSFFTPQYTRVSDHDDIMM